MPDRKAGQGSGAMMIDDKKNERPAPTDLAGTQAAAKAETAEAGEMGREGSDSGKVPGGVDVQAYIGRQLRAVYDDVAKQPVPERFLALMKQLEEQKPDR